MMVNSENWHGDERRTCPERGACLDHAGIVEKISNNERRTYLLEKQNYVPFGIYKWSLGIVISILISLFSISIYISIETKNQLAIISKAQESTIVKIIQVQKEIEDLKRQIQKKP